MFEKIKNENLTSLSIRKKSRNTVLGCIRDEGLIPRTEISEITGLTEAAISRITRELLEAGLLREVLTGKGEAKKGRGRPLVGLELNDKGAFALGIDMSAISQSITLIDLCGKIFSKRELNFTSMKAPLAVLSAAAEEAKRMICISGIPETLLLGAGVAVAGVVDSNNRVLIKAPNLGWDNVPVADLLEKHLNMPIVVSSRPGAILMAEHRRGIAKGKNEIALFLASLGIGGAIMVSGSLVAGHRNSAGQIGHLPVTSGSEICTCGRNDCLDTKASGHSILTRLGLVPRRDSKTGHGPADSKLLLEVKDKAEKGDLSARRSLNKSGFQLGRALRGIGTVLDPEIIIIAGTLAQSQNYMHGVIQGFGNFNEIQLSASAISEDIAAAWLALDVFAFSENLEFSRFQASLE